MKKCYIHSGLVLLMGALCWLALPSAGHAQTDPNAPQGKLVWDATAKESHPKVGDKTADFKFYFTNVSPVEVVITDKHHCGCTAAKIPPLPWTNAPGAIGEADFSVDIHDKTGTVVKTINMNSTAGLQILTLTVYVPDKQAGRDANMALAAVDRQAVFKNDCATCHAIPAKDKTGQALYQAVCAICHDAEHRAPAVADLRNLKHPTNREFWKVWITHGKPGTMMPAFAEGQGGPLTEEQISSLADYMVDAFPSTVK